MFSNSVAAAFPYKHRKKYKIMKQHISILATLLLYPILGIAQGNLVFNGGFDTSAAGWLASNIGVNGGYFATKGNPDGFFFLYNNAPSPTTDPTIRQTINGLVPGVTYLVSGDVAFSRDHGGSFPTEPSFGVALNGVSLFEFATQGQLGWQHFGFLYTPSSSSAVLSLSSQINNTDISYLIDNIFMQVPEPSSLALLTLGGFCFARHRFRTCRSKPSAKAIASDWHKPASFPA